MHNFCISVLLLMLFVSNKFDCSDSLGVFDSSLQNCSLKKGVLVVKEHYWFLHLGSY